MKTNHYTLFGLVSLSLSLITLEANGLNLSSTDLWDVSQGSVVTNHSGALDWGGNFISFPQQAFGAAISGTAEADAFIFGDHAQGFVHFVEWMTPKPIRLENFLLSAGHDGAGRDINFRGFSYFALYAEGNKIFDFVPSNPYSLTPAPPNSVLESIDYSSLRMLVNLPPIVAQHFRMEATQYGNVSHALGPRIHEVDGFGVIVPEPISLSLFLVGSLILLPRRVLHA